MIRSEKNDEMIDIPIPNSHIGKAPISCRMLSDKKYDGMVRETLREDA
jgi:hypothetical protein